MEPLPKVRDRDGAERKIILAAMEVLAEGGHQAFGVNSIARRAQYDKQLIYRYFGGLEGVADAIGVELANRLSEQLSPLSAIEAPKTYGALSRVLILGLLDLLRVDPVMQKIIAWEIAAPSPLVHRMIAERGKRLGVWMHSLRGGLRAPDGIDAPAVNAALIASTQQLVLSASANASFAGMPLASEADWDRLRSALTAMITAIYGP